jgi:hypothetical protein
MTVIGADLPAALLISLALVLIVSGWVAWERHETAVRRQAKWLSENHPAEWQAQPWFDRALVRNAIETLRRQGYGNHPEFVRLQDVASLHYRRSVLRVVAGAAALGLVGLGVSLLGWRLG